MAIRPVTRIHTIPNHLKVSLMSRSESKTLKLIARAGVGVAILLGAVSAVVAQPASGGMPGMMQHGDWHLSK